ncbi:hypothetical protein K505DRAFT_234699 [Melanomma pulvis-pyrius CBS 109.77]|uniref:Uncharacterized protein n=1 Tax=Melanomma pulvis-pyrius CBS 109.77 TaxID=1314802 RepID=A0A6A6XMN5_9PLEO|nr:hypothetical protein K505DRAFT_234699 [Melanomma pulvis-pyrius CBS 109.77]
MYAVPEGLAVQEFAFRRGQQDRGNTRDRVPANPFHPAFNVAWVSSYHRGKRSTADAIELAADPPSPSRANYDWPPLVNVYTQTPEHPRGSYDEKYARSACETALDGMESLIKAVCQRGKQWDKAICDVPQPIAVALQNYPDLMDRYDYLKTAAKEAIGGGLPFLSAARRPAE